MKRSPYDLEVENHGSIYTLAPYSPFGQQWIEEHLPADAQTFGRTAFGGIVVVEHRYIGDIVRGAQADRMEVR